MNLITISIIFFFNLLKKIKRLKHMKMFEYQSSPVDWCEPNFSVSDFLAEFYNTLSALPMLYVAYILWVPNHKIYASIVLGIGVGTMIFHGTLNLFGQLFDELCLVIYLSYLMRIPRYLLLPLTCILFIYPQINAYLLISTALIIIVGWQCNLITLNLPLKAVTGNGMGTSIKSQKLLIFVCLIAGVLWIIDIACINGIHFHFIWHLFAAYILYLTRDLTITF